MTNDIYDGKNPQNIARGATSRAQGAMFENIISASCDYYREQGYCYIEKTPEPFRVTQAMRNHTAFTGHFAKKAQPDFKGVLKNGRAIVIEAKHTDTKRISKDRISDTQAAALDQYAAMQAHCYVAVSFGLQSIYLIPWDIWRNMELIMGRKYITEDDIQTYKRRFTGTIAYLFGEAVKNEKQA